MAPQAWDDSWSIISCFNYVGNTTETEVAFHTNALRIRKFTHVPGCWRSRDAIKLINGTCDTTPLGDTYQYLTDIQLGFPQYYLSVITSYLGPFCTNRNSSSWLFPTYVATVAAMYYSRTTEAMMEIGSLPLQPAGSGNQPHFYKTTQSMTLTKPVMRHAVALWLVLACQPFLTLLALITTLFFHKIPLRRGFGMVSILAGFDGTSLHLLHGASRSGELRELVKLEIAVKKDVRDGAQGVAEARSSVQYKVTRYNPQSRYQRLAVQG